MTISDEEKRKIRENWRIRSEKEREKEKIRRKEAMDRVYKIAKFLKEKYSVKRVILYGSLAREGPFDDLSDIDIFVDGWDDSKFNYWSMFIEVEDIARPYKVSVVTQKDVGQALLKEIAKEGREIV
ncbi:nucleotidyltransferase domain-containing protein [Thermoanaerobacter brockii subsp. lactiethylicus]|jgi:predicted nucleotidyltransferase|uniref:DNA polymerase, beta domain protein region n=2 Tax=Thermoanaerobacter TaxID=1754 RepID=B0KAT0_THEP3|nr:MULTISPECIES: nucleotidyltransferase domain-containing protein [Thermoanaerobacter]ABY93518.1 DNA polymerase, beta domain protein region [Thermoanaerobacter sp. X514]ABY95214.1 DNA polymerase, beta domain protein region [Thermoanaerobacter pseudethanolicus ATCC 33223]ADV80164.1 DNA polymerase beta domain protein region [Thermoanaerobacter brockii subsp. finnii Ako-1]HBW60623.1 DNA polymerase subunit beta [Thermoanaerobacter sp.]HCD08913.1 DNA polymerase subunit beta [Thermoanaerobacter sp.]